MLFKKLLQLQVCIFYFLWSFFIKAYSKGIEENSHIGVNDLPESIFFRCGIKAHMITSLDTVSCDTLYTPHHSQASFFEALFWRNC